MPGNGQDAAWLLRQAQQGDAAAFAALIRGITVRLLLYLRRHARNVLGADCDEEDILQVALGRAWGALSSFEDQGPGSLHRWLLSFCRSAVADRRRYLDAKGRGSALQGLPYALEESRYLWDQVTSIPGRSAFREEVQRADQALKMVPESQRDVIERHYLQGQSLGEIAAELGLHKNAVWERLHRGMARLRSLLPDPTPSPP